jgi:hypothetical protein
VACRGSATWHSYSKFDGQILAQDLAVSAKDKITDTWDHFDVKAILPEHAADLGTVFGTQEEIGRKMT